MAAKASRRKPAKRRRKAEEQQPSEAQQEGELEKIPSCCMLSVPACSPFFVQPVHPPWLNGVPVKGFDNREDSCGWPYDVAMAVGLCTCCACHHRLTISALESNLRKGNSG